MPAGLKYPCNGILLASWHTKPAIASPQTSAKTQNNKITVNYGGGGYSASHLSSSGIVTICTYIIPGNFRMSESSAVHP